MTISLVHTATSTSGANYVTSASVTASAPVATGNSLLLFVACSSNADNVASVSDSLGNTWVKLGSGAVSGNACGSFWFCASANAGTPTVTAKAPAGTYIVWNLILREYSGLAGTLDVLGSSVEAGYVSTHTASATMTNASDLIVAAYVCTNSADTFTPDSSLGNVAATTGAAYLGAVLADKTTSAAGSVSATFSSATTDQGAMLLVGLKALSGSSVPAAPQNLVVVPGNTQNTLSWSDVGSTTSYKVYRSSASGTRGSVLSTVTPPAAGNAHGIANLPNFPLAFYDDFSTNVAEGSFINAAGTGQGAYSSWHAYPTGYNDTEANNAGTNSGYDNTILSVSNSQLHIRQHVDSTGRALGAVLWPALPGYGDCETKYGRTESMIRCLKPVQGYKTAWLWWNKRYDLQSTDPQHLNWPHGGETDFPEGNTNGTMGVFLHWYGANTGSDQDAYGSSVRYDSGWHIITQEWTPNSWKFWIDGTLLGATTGPHVCTDYMRYVLQNETALSTSTRPIAGADNVIDVEYTAVWNYQNGYTP